MVSVSLHGIGRFFTVVGFWGGGVFGLVSLIVVGGGLVLVLTSVYVWSMFPVILIVFCHKMLNFVWRCEWIL